MIVLRESDYVSTPWKNGGGVTREIHRDPPPPAEFDWRLSLATIDRAGPFSAFGGYERTLVLVRGAGIELSFGAHGTSRLSSAGQTISFDGAWQTHCTVLEGPSTDLNLIVSQQRAQYASRSVLVSTTERVQTAGWPETLICCILESVRITTAAGATEELAPVDIARCFPQDGLVTCHARASRPARVFVASVRRR